MPMGPDQRMYRSGRTAPAIKVLLGWVRVGPTLRGFDRVHHPQRSNCCLLLLAEPLIRGVGAGELRLATGFRDSNCSEHCRHLRAVTDVDRGTSVDVPVECAFEVLG